MIRDHMVLASFNTKTKKLKISSFQNIASCDIITLWNSEQTVIAKSLQTFKRRQEAQNRPLSHEICRDKLLHKCLAIILSYEMTLEICLVLANLSWFKG